MVKKKWAGGGRLLPTGVWQLLGGKLLQLLPALGQAELWSLALPISPPASASFNFFRFPPLAPHLFAGVCFFPNSVCSGSLYGSVEGEPLQQHVGGAWKVALEQQRSQLRLSVQGACYVHPWEMGFFCFRQELIASLLMKIFVVGFYLCLYDRLF